MESESDVQYLLRTYSASNHFAAEQISVVFMRFIYSRF
uniref:Uncharacterized protein n=1 Tax=Heterorhabditis bacteriophora TaxID=37862 RepID=A0A1I7WK98_HETBA